MPRVVSKAGLPGQRTVWTVTAQYDHQPIYSLWKQTALVVSLSCGNSHAHAAQLSLGSVLGCASVEDPCTQWLKCERPVATCSAFPTPAQISSSKHQRHLCYGSADRGMSKGAPPPGPCQCTHPYPHAPNMFDQPPTNGLA